MHLEPILVFVTSLNDQRGIIRDLNAGFDIDILLTASAPLATMTEIEWFRTIFRTAFSIPREYAPAGTPRLSVTTAGLTAFAATQSSPAPASKERESSLINAMPDEDTHVCIRKWLIDCGVTAHNGRHHTTAGTVQHTNRHNIRFLGDPHVPSHRNPGCMCAYVTRLRLKHHHNIPIFR